MELIVEIGTEEQKELIKQEIKHVENVIDKLDLSQLIKQIIIPEDFDKKVNEIQETNHYKSARGHFAVGKNISTKDGIYLVFSRHLFTDEFDTNTRYQIYIHELVHAFNKNSFPCILNISQSKYIYLTNLYTLFDEYDANRKSLQCVENVFPQSSQLYERSIRANLKGFIKTLIDNPGYYQNIQHEISKFRLHGNAVQFLENIDPFFDAASKAIVYSYSFIDHYSKLKRFEPILLKSNFINDKTILLIEFFRIKFNDKSPDLLEGIKLIENFMENFGMRLKDTSDGLYCKVLDI